MSWQTAIMLGGLLALALVCAYLIHRASKQAEEAADAAAIERGKTIDIQARESRTQALEAAKKMTDEELLADVQKMVDPFKKGKKEKR